MTTCALTEDTTTADQSTYHPYTNPRRSDQSLFQASFILVLATISSFPPVPCTRSNKANHLSSRPGRAFLTAVMDDLEFPYPGIPSPIHLVPQPGAGWESPDADWGSGRGATYQASTASGLGSCGVPVALSLEESPQHSPSRGDTPNMESHQEQQDREIPDGELLMNASLLGAAPPATPMQGGEPSRGVGLEQALGGVAPPAHRDGHGHEDPRPATDTLLLYECNVCHRAFAKSQALGGHINTHRKGEASMDGVCTPFPLCSDFGPQEKADSLYLCAGDHTTLAA